MVEYYKDKTYSLATIRRLAQAKTSYNEGPCTGINPIEALNALDSLVGKGLYRVGTGVDAKFVQHKATIGPVLVGVHYGSYPTKKGKCGRRYNLRHAEISGKTDCSFTGAHAVVVIGSKIHRSSTGKYLHTDMYARDPDHNSPTRPEKPAYDKFRRRDLLIAMRNLPRKTAFQQTFVIYPTRRK